MSRVFHPVAFGFGPIIVEIEKLHTSQKNKYKFVKFLKLLTSVIYKYMYTNLFLLFSTFWAVHHMIIDFMNSDSKLHFLFWLVQRLLWRKTKKQKKKRITPALIGWKICGILKRIFGVWNSELENRIWNWVPKPSLYKIGTTKNLNDAFSAGSHKKSLSIQLQSSINNIRAVAHFFLSQFFNLMTIHILRKHVLGGLLTHPTKM